MTSLMTMQERACWPEDWPERLHAHIASCGARGFVWGENDCACFTWNWVRDITGYDPMAAFRGRYSTAAGSLKALRRHGTGELVSTFDALMPPRINPRRGRRGDAVAALSVQGPALGLCIGPEAVFLGPCSVSGIDGSGIVFLPMRAAIAVWPVG